jgi:hypothetical protein
LFHYDGTDDFLQTGDTWEFVRFEINPNNNVEINDAIINIDPLCTDLTVIAHFREKGNCVLRLINVDGDGTD